MTVRRDLAAVEKSGLVKNVNGVLVSNSGNTVQVLDKEYDLLNETQVQNEVKKLIGRFAATMIVPGDCVIFDTGTTTEQIAMAIPPEMDFEALCFTRNTLERLCRLPHVNIALAGRILLSSNAAVCWRRRCQFHPQHSCQQTFHLSCRYS